MGEAYERGGRKPSEAQGGDRPRGFGGTQPISTKDMTVLFSQIVHFCHLSLPPLIICRWRRPVQLDNTTQLL